MLISDALAQTGNAAEVFASNSVSGTLIQLGLIFVIFYFLLIRPQQKKIREHENMLNAIKKGDKIITGGGVFGTVVKVAENTLNIEIANGVEIVVARSSVRDLADEIPAAPVSQPKADKKDKKKSAKK